MKKNHQESIHRVLDEAIAKIERLIGNKVTLKLRIVRNGLIPVNENRTELSECICDEFGVPYDALTNRIRNRKTVNARMVYCYLAYHELYLSLHQIATLLGRDHTTIMYNRDRCQDLIDIDDPIKINIENIKNKMVW